MKMKLFTLLLTLFTFVSFAQKDNYIKENLFYTNFTSGVGEKIQVKFKFGSDFQTKVIENEIFKKWEVSTYTDSSNAGYVEKWKNQTHLETYLMGLTGMASFYAKLELKNGGSYSPIKDSEGFIYINDKGSINVSFPFKAQNGLGNMIFAKAYYIESLIDGKEETKHFISND